MSIQCSSVVLMVRPACFGYNAETAESNAFQQKPTEDWRLKAVEEFDHAAAQLQHHGMKVLIAEDLNIPLPDSVFPNNWFSTHVDGSVIIYPMQPEIRRKEKRHDIFQSLLPGAGFKINCIHDLSYFEKENKFLEGTGSMVMNHEQKIIYACRSVRTHEEPLKAVSDLLGYQYRLFNALLEGKEIYHTNVMMAVGNGFAVICPEVMEEKSRKKILDELSLTHELILISPYQLKHMAGNMLMTVNKNGQPLCILSQTAFDSLLPGQLKRIESFAMPVICQIPTIERIGGGSIRCMLAEIFLPSNNMADGAGNSPFAKG